MRGVERREEEDLRKSFDAWNRGFEDWALAAQLAGDDGALLREPLLKVAVFRLIDGRLEEADFPALDLRAWLWFFLGADFPERWPEAFRDVELFLGERSA